MKTPEIKCTNDYDQFSSILGNRIINQKKVTQLVEDINNGLNLLPYCPLLCFKKDGLQMIVDGQHRFEACVKVNSPVYYVECEKMDLKQIALINSRSDKWKNKDFLECYSRLGIEDYVILKEFLTEYGIVYSAAVDLLMHNRIGSKAMEDFRDGKFKANHTEEAKRVTGLTQDLFERYVFRNDRYLIAAIQELEKKGLCDFEILKQKIAAAPMLMDKQSSMKEYIFNIERVYNHHNQKRIRIF